MSQSKQDLDTLLKSLPKHMTPTKDLWARIQPQLTQQAKQPKTSNWRIMAMAASIVIVSFLGILTWQHQYSTRDPLLTQTTSSISTIANTPNALSELVDQISQTHQAQIDAFISNQYTHNWSLVTASDKQLQPDINKALVELRVTSIQVQAALKQQPENQQMWQLWRWLMKREITLLQQGQKLPFSSTVTSQGNTI